MQDHVAPPLVEPTTEGSLADLPARNAARNPANVAFSRKEGERLGRRHGARVPRRRARGRQGTGRRGRPARRPGRDHEQDPLRVDAGRLRDLDRRRVSPCRSTRPPRPSRFSWILERLRRRRHHPRDARPRSHRRRGARPAARAQARLADRRRRPRRARARRARRSATPSSTPAASGVDRTSSLATIIYTSGTTGRPKGVPADPRQLHGAVRQRHHQGSSRSFKADGASTLLFLPLAHVFARFIQVAVRHRRGQDGPQRRHQEPARGLRRRSSRRSSSRCRASSRRSTTPPRQKATAEGKGKIFATAAETAIAWSTAQDERRGRPRPQGASTACSTSSSTASCAPRWAARSCTPSPAAPRSAPASATSSAASASPSSRATASPRRPRPPRSTRRTQVKIGTVGAPLPGVGIRDRRRRRDPDPAATTSSRATATTTRRPRARCATAGSTPATSASSTRTATSGSPAARRSSSSPPAARTSRRPCSRTASAPTRWSRQCIVVGDQKPFIAALVTLDAEMYPAWAEEQRHRRASPSSRPATNETVLGRDPDGPSTTPTRRSPRPSRSASSRSSPGDFTEENGYLTP